MKILIFTEAGNNSGLGHLTRCISLYNEARKQGYCSQLIINGHLKGINLLEGLEYYNFDWRNLEYLERIIQLGDHCIVDSYLADYSILNYIFHKANKTIFLNDDIKNLKYPPGIIVNLSLIHYNDLSEINIPKNTELFSGPDYIILRSEFANHDSQLYINETVDNVLLIMGGTDIRKITPRVTNILATKFPSIHFTVVSNDIKSVHETINNKYTNNISIVGQLNSGEVLNLMNKADLVVSAAGQTIYELIRLNKPFIPIQVVENQKGNVEGLLRHFKNIQIINFEDPNFEDELLISFRKFLARNKRIEHLNYLSGLIDGLGAKRIINKLCNN